MKSGQLFWDQDNNTVLVRRITIVLRNLEAHGTRKRRVAPAVARVDVRLLRQQESHTDATSQSVGDIS